MTFFYDLNKKLDSIREKPETTHKQLNEDTVDEGWKGEIAGGVGGALTGTVLGGPGLGTAIGAAVGAPLGRHLGGPDEPTKEQQLNEIAPLLAAGAKALLPMLARIGPALSKAIQSPAVKQGAEVVARGTGQVAKQGAKIAAKSAIPIGIGAGAYSAITDLAQKVAGGVGQVYSDASDAASEIAAAVGNVVDEKTIAELATMAVKYALPIGVVVALLYGGKKLIDKLMGEKSVTEGDDMRDLLNKLDYVTEGYKGAMGGAAIGSLVGGAPGAALGAIAGDTLGDKMPSDPDVQKATSKITSKLSTAEGSTGDYSAKKARAGKDIGKPGKMFSKIAKDAGERYGSEERGEKVAGAVLAKLRGKNESIEETMTDEKTAAQQALQALGQGDNQDMIKDLQRRAGVPQTGKVQPAQPGQQPMAEADVEEGNKFTGNLMKARAAGKKQADLDGDGDLEPVREAAKPDYIDLDKDGNRRETMKKAAADKKAAGHEMEESALQAYLGKKKYGTSGMKALQKAGREGASQATMNKIRDKHDKYDEGIEDRLKDLDPKNPVNIPAYQRKAAEQGGRTATNTKVPPIAPKQQKMEEGWDDMMKDVEDRAKKPKVGSVERGAKHDIEHTATGRKVTRRVDDQGMSVGTDDEKDSGEKRGRGRPKKTDRAPERVTAKAYKHKGGRKMSKEEIEEAIAALEGHGYAVSKLDEKAVSVAQRRAAGIAHAAQKGEIPSSELRGASKQMAKMPKGELAKFAKTKEKGLPKKKEESVEETTVAGSVAPSTDAPKSKGKGGMTFGKGIYDSLNRELETMISESMNVSVNMSVDEHGESRKTLSVNAEGEDAEQLAQLLNLAGIAHKDSGHSDCGCGTSPCSCEEMVDENATDWPTNTAVTGDDDPQMTRWSGGLNKPKSTGQTTTPVVNRDPRRGSYGPVEASADLKEANDLGMNLYRELKNFKAK